MSSSLCNTHVYAYIKFSFSAIITLY